MTDFADQAQRNAPWVLAVAGRKGRTLSGFHFRDGLVFTADHGLNGEGSTTVSWEGGASSARVLGRDPGSDLALLQVSDAELPSPELRSDVEGIRPGEAVAILARHPEDGLGVSAGVVACRAGAWKTWRGGSLEHLLQADLRVYNGYAGGPLIDSHGRLLGLVTPALSRDAPIVLTVPTLERVAALLQERAVKGRAYLGVGLHDVRLDEQDGSMIVTLEKEGPAARGGLLLGDILVRLGDRDVAGTEETLAVLATFGAEVELPIGFIRGGEPREATVITGQRPRP